MMAHDESKGGASDGGQESASQENGGKAGGIIEAMSHPYTTLIDKEAERAESDLSAFRSRAITVLTTSSAIVTLMTGLVTFAATKVEAENSRVPILAIVAVTLSLLFFVMALVFALVANSPGEVQSPSAGSTLLLLTNPERWKNGDPLDEAPQDCEVAQATVEYLLSVRKLAESTSENLRIAIGYQIAGVGVGAAAALVVFASLA